MKQKASEFAAWCGEQWKNKCGYILCTIGQDPKTLREWYFSGQYEGKQLTRANYWRENAPRVFDCQGMADGYLTEKLGYKVNVRARNNYAEWCGIKGSGMIPSEKRVPGAAVFKKSSYVHHVGFLYQPIENNNPEGDWYVIEAKGVMYGVVRTKLSEGKWNLWGYMTEYFDYDQSEETSAGVQILKKGAVGKDVAALQNDLIALGYSCGKWGADGEFGEATEAAVRVYQHDRHLTEDGEVGEETRAALDTDLQDCDEAPAETENTGGGSVVVQGGNWYIRIQPSKQGAKLGIAREGVSLETTGAATDEWLGVRFAGEEGWISKKGVGYL